MTEPSSPLYLDTSCLLKLFFREAESERVARAIAAEGVAIVSELTRVEAETQLRARLLGGHYSRAKHKKLVEELERTLMRDPFTVVRVPADAFATARSLVGQVKVHCRTLDLLHLAVMATCGVTRLFTNDAGQATVARDLGMEVQMPR